MKKLTTIWALIFLSAISAFAQTTEFTYQGKLTDANGTAANYDFEFRLFAQMSGGTALGTQSRAGVPVSNNVFTVSLDFGAQFDGTPRYLEIAVKPVGSATYTTLTPRQSLTSAPYAVRSLNAATAINSTQLGGLGANQFVQTGDARLSDNRNPLAGSTNYVQNSTSPQPATNFNITGGGTVGGAFSANTVNAATQFNLGGNRFLSVSGQENTFVGIDAGTATVNGRNVFVGREAGKVNTTGAENTFVGAFSGNINGGGQSNTFFGAGAGVANTSGNFNTFVGRTSGINNTTGSENTLVGNATTLGANNLTYASAFGSGATVNNSNSVVLGRSLDTVRVPGDVVISGNLIANLPGGDASYIQNRTTAQAGTTNFNITGNGTIGGTLNAANISGSTISGVIVNSNVYRLNDDNILKNFGTRNIFVGVSAGGAGTDNAFFGYNAGNSNLSAGIDNSFFGSDSGGANTSGNQNSFFGSDAGDSNTTGNNNSFFGRSAGSANGSGNFSSFFGARSGIVSTGGSNSFFGYGAGAGNTSGAGNVFFGKNAGDTNTTGGENTVIGDQANVGSSGLSYATAIGAGATVSTSNTVQLGRSAGQDDVYLPGYLRLPSLRSINATTHLCIDAQNYVSSCASNFAGADNAELLDTVKNQRTQIERLQNEIEALKKLVCSQNQTAEICKEEK